MQPCNNSSLRSKRQSFDLDEVQTNSPPWPPVKSPAQNCPEDDKDMSNGNWVDKVMVNKLEVNRDENPLGCWGADNEHLSDMFYQKYLQDTSKIFPEQSYNIFMGSTQMNSSSMDEMDDHLDAATSDSSEPDLLWQFNQTKLTGITNSIGSKIKKTNLRQAKSPDLR